MLEVRVERVEDYEAVFQVLKSAFGRENEAWLVEKIRKSDCFTPQFSLVAVKDGELAGHILFSRVVIQARAGDVPALGLAPVAVLPELQKQGIGSRLVRQGLDECRRLGHKIVVLVGHPDYYPRFGFLPARAKGLGIPFPVPDRAFMALELVPGALDQVSGMVVHPPEFSEV